MAIVYLILGTMIIYYGEKISNLFAITNSNNNDNNDNEIGLKLRILSISIGGLFLIKSLCGFIAGFHLFGNFYPTSIGANVWDFFVILFLYF